MTHFDALSTYFDVLCTFSGTLKISRIEYSAFNKVGERRIPFEVRAFRDRTVVAKVKVMELTPITVEDPALFLAPPKSEFWPDCNDMQYPELVGRVYPMYPPSARSNRATPSAISA